MLASLALSTGCLGPATVFEILDYREPGPARRYRETFEQAYYDLDGHGAVDIILHRTEPNQRDPEQATTQTIHIRGVWRSIPGDTVAQRTQINGTVRYWISGGGITGRFEGAGALFFTHSQRSGVLTGTLDCASLRPADRVDGEGALFERAEVGGKFQARRDPRRVVRMVNEMNRHFQAATAPGGLRPPRP